jgi:hypothetical protein
MILLSFFVYGLFPVLCLKINLVDNEGFQKYVAKMKERVDLGIQGESDIKVVDKEKRRSKSHSNVIKEEIEEEKED